MTTESSVALGTSVNLEESVDVESSVNPEASGCRSRLWIQNHSAVLPAKDLSSVRAESAVYADGNRFYSGGQAHYGGWTDEST